MCLDKWGLYIEHLGHDNWISLKMEMGKNVIMLAMFIDLLEIIFYHLLSKSKNQTLCQSCVAITKTNVKHLLSKYNQIDGENYYQNL